MGRLLKTQLLTILLCAFIACGEKSASLNSYLIFSPIALKNASTGTNYWFVQNSAQPGGKVTLDVTNKPPREFFAALSEQSGRKIAISPALQTPITIKVSGSPLPAVLEALAAKYPELIIGSEENIPTVSVSAQAQDDTGSGTLKTIITELLIALFLAVGALVAYKISSRPKEYKRDSWGD